MIRNGGVLGLTLVALAMALVVPASAQAGRPIDAGLGCRTALCATLSTDGSRVVFPRPGELIAGAGDRQVYEWREGQLKALLPSGFPPDQWVQLDGVSADAAHVFLTTRAALSPADIDGSGLDIYDLQNGTATLASTGPLDRPGAPGELPIFQGASPDGSRIFFQDMRALTTEDLDSCPSLYERAAGQTRIVAPNPKPPRHPVCEWARFGGVSGDGSRLFFVSGVGLQAGDEGEDDIYQQVGPTLTRLTTYPQPRWNCVARPSFVASSADGNTILFSTNTPVVPEDTNGNDDLYKRRPDGSFALVSKGTPAGQNCVPSMAVRGVALAADGGRTIFETTAALSPADLDAAADLYAADESGAFELLSTGPTDPHVAEPTTVSPDWVALASADARTVAFETRQRLLAADRDDSLDVYARVGGITSLLSAGPAARSGSRSPWAELAGISADGSTVVFATREGLVAGDTNGERDFYLRRLDAARPVLLSAERMAPKMRVAPGAVRLRLARVAVRLGCPETESNGPCRGTLRLAAGRSGGPLGKSSFSIAVGKRQRIVVRLRKALPPTRRSLLASARGADALGNAALVTRKVRLGG